MATEIVRLPAYVQPAKLAGGRMGYYWIRPQWAKPPAMRHGKLCPVESTPLGSDRQVAIERGEAINAAFKEWREGTAPRVTPGSVTWLFRWYREQEKFTDLRAITRTGYLTAMTMVEAIEMKVGIFGTRVASAVDAPAADALYKKARAKHGERQGAYMMQVCRLVWNAAARPGYSKITGVKANPFAAMGIKASTSKGKGKGNVAATRAQYDLYRVTAREMGKQSMAAAAALCFEGCQRVFDAFGFVDPDGRIDRGVKWRGYVAGKSLALIQSKTGNEIDIPLVDEIDGELLPLYPELEEELARTPRGEAVDLIVRDERTGVAYTKDYMTKLHRRICVKAGLPATIKFTSFRHGGITELGDSGSDDVRAVSGHVTLETTRIYNKANQAKARQIATRRREHIAAVLAGAKVGEDEEAEL